MENLQDPSMHHVRQGRVGDHLSAIGTHIRFLFAAMMGGEDLGGKQTVQKPASGPSNPKEVPKNIIVPYGSRKERWDMLIMLLILYSAATVPVRVCFDAHAEGWVWVFEVMMSTAFLADLVLGFFTAYQVDGVWVYDRGRIARSYMLGWFWIDGPSALPVELIEFYFEETHNIKNLKDLATLRFLRMFLLFRLLRLLKVKEYITRVEEAFMINLRILKLLEIFVKLGFMSHILGCGWFYMHVIRAEGEVSWVSEYDGGSALEGPLSKQ